MPKLLGEIGNPFVRKVRMVLAEKGIAYEMITGSDDDRVAEINPLGKTPALLTDDERSVYDSRVIVDYLEVLQPEPALLPPVGLERVSVRRWEALADGLCDAGVAVMTEGQRDNELQRSPEFIERQLAKVQRAVVALGGDIEDREYCHGGRLTLADLAVMAALGYVDFRLPAIHWRDEFPNLAEYFARHAQRRSFVETAPPPL